MEELLMLDLGFRIGRRRERLQRRRILRNLRDSMNPFAIEDSIFIKYFRLPKLICKNLMEELKVHDTQPSKLNFTARFLSVLDFLAHGSYQKCVGSGYAAAMSQASVSRNISYITKLLVRRKYKEICFPQTAEEFLEVKTGFHRKFLIKGTVGAIDCTHISIVSPPINDPETPAHLYMNRKGYYSINVEAICDSDLKFLHINVKFPGSCHDSGIWTTSPVRMRLMREHEPHQFTWLIGDSGYPLEPWLLTPYAEPSSVKESKFNELHMRSRNVIERAFGVLKSTFRCLHKHRTLHYPHEKVGFIVYACAILHNILRSHGILAADEMDSRWHESVNEDETEIIEVSQRDYFREGRRLRELYTNTL